MLKTLLEQGASLLRTIRKYDRRIEKERQVEMRLADDAVRAGDKKEVIEHQVRRRAEYEAELCAVRAQYIEEATELGVDDLAGWDDVGLGDYFDVQIGFEVFAPETVPVSEAEFTELTAAINQLVAKVDTLDANSRAELANARSALNSSLALSGKLKATFPIIPLLLRYETELKLSESLNLTSWWGKVTGWFKREG